jgi:ABC-type multidrug transport system fused ATPase/permease subunit
MAEAAPERGMRRFLGVFRYTGRAFRLVWDTSKPLSIALGVLSIVAGVAPAAVAFVGKLVVDSVVRAIESGADGDRNAAIVWVGVELGLVAVIAAAQRGLDVSQSLLRALLGQRVNEMILDKALTLSLRDFEDPELYDQMTRARREASSRPLSLVRRAFGLAQNAISLVGYGGLILAFSPLALLVLALAAVPAFVVETRFSDDAFRLFRWRAPETRKQLYLETVLAREDNAKEVKLFELGRVLLDRYREIFRQVYAEDRALTIRRGLFGFLLGLASTLALYGAYVWVVLATIAEVLTLGGMTMYLLVFKQGQSALSAMLSAIGGMYEDNLYLSNLYELLAHGTGEEKGRATSGPRPGDGLRLEEVGFVYPGAERPALDGVTLHLPPGQKLALVGENGAGKTTLIKLLSRLYEPTSGRILLDGLDLREWDLHALRRRIGVIFQDFVRYQLLVGENIGTGDVEAFDDHARWKKAAVMGMADTVIEKLPERYDTQLGKWFKGGVELSGGQWQKIALARAFMREEADILVLDEPTSAMDAEAEATIFQRFKDLTKDRMAILISHRFSTVRMADRIAVLDGGRITELGSHDELVAMDGRYARLFSLQAEGYR